MRLLTPDELFALADLLEELASQMKSAAHEIHRTQYDARLQGELPLPLGPPSPPSVDLLDVMLPILL